MKKEYKTYRGWWGEFTRRPNTFSVVYNHGFYFERRANISIGGFFGHLHLNLPWKLQKQPDSDWKRYGIYTMGDVNEDKWLPDQIWFPYGLKSKVWNLPWQLSHYKTTYKIQLPDSGYAQLLEGKYWRSDWNIVYYLKENFEVTETYPYTYKLVSGKLQEIKATCSIVTREWRRKAWMWSDWKNFKVTRLEIKFSEEVGERSGSWKGGTVGCSWNLLEGETIQESLKRMELTRKFN